MTSCPPKRRPQIPSVELSPEAMRRFKDIEIVDLETETHYQAQHEPQRYYFYLRLSSVCPSGALSS